VVRENRPTAGLLHRGRNRLFDSLLALGSKMGRRHRNPMKEIPHVVAPARSKESQA
jgi:hypothetical protein